MSPTNLKDLEMKYLVMFLSVLALQGCEYTEKKNKMFIEAYKTECASRGYDSINIKYIGGLVSSYYTCFNK